MIKYLFCTFLLFCQFTYGQNRPRVDTEAKAIYFDDLNFRENIDESSYQELVKELPIDSLKAIYLKRSVLSDVDLSGYQNQPPLIVSISDTSKVEKLILNSYSLKLFVNNSSISEFDLANCAIESLNIQNTSIRKLSLSEAQALKSMYISRKVFCDTIDFRGFVTNSTSTLSVISTSRWDQQPTTLIFDYSSRFDNMDIDLTKYDLQMDDRCDDCQNSDSYNTFFTTELAYLKTRGQDKNYERLYYIYRKWQVKDSNFFIKLFNYYLPKEFYGFGLKKSLILRATLILFIISVVITRISYNTIKEAYTFEFKDGGANIGMLYKAFILASIVFFSFKMEYKNINFAKTKGVLLLFIIFSTGLLCYAFLANFIFTFK